MLAAVGCCCRQWTEPLKGFTSLSCVNKREILPASGVPVSPDAAMVGPSLKSVWKLFFREGKLIGVSAEDLDQFLGLITCSASRPNQPPPPGSMHEIPDAVPSPSGKVERHSGRPRRLRQDMRRRSDCGASALFSTHDTHADLIHQALTQCKRIE